jgi:metallo-beta-lactamase family protein
LLKHGYRGPIYGTQATLELAELILKDSAKIQEQDYLRKMKRRPNDPPLPPLYTQEDLKTFGEQKKEIQLHQPIQVADGISARFFEAGHMLGSTCIELTDEDKGKRYVIAFSGDLGPQMQPIVRPFESIPHADLVFLESTYGDRNHRPYQETVQELERIIRQAIEQKGKVLIPAFAIGRTQQILYHLAILFFEKKLDPFPVYVDSPMGIEASQIFAKHPDLFDDEATDWKKKGLLPLDKRYFKTTKTADESKQLNDEKGPCVILAGAGMCNAGRIQHHLKFNLPNASTHVMFVGFQGHGSLGRLIVDGKKEVKIHGELIPVNAQIHTLNGFSAHAGQTDLLKWFDPLGRDKPRVVLTHGEDPQRGALSQQIKDKYQLNPLLPKLDEVIEL